MPVGHPTLLIQQRVLHLLDVQPGEARLGASLTQREEGGTVGRLDFGSMKVPGVSVLNRQGPRPGSGAVIQTTALE